MSYSPTERFKQNIEARIETIQIQHKRTDRHISQSLKIFEEGELNALNDVLDYINHTIAIRNKKIVTSYVYPPIPCRSYDWSAVTEGYEEGEPMGWGPTKERAIEDLMEQLEEVS